MPNLTTKTAVIADDHPVTLHGMKTILEQLGYKVTGIFQNGTQAFNHLLTAPSNIALLDIQMPGLSGIDIVIELAKNNISTKTIIYTMFNDHSLFKRSQEAGVNGYILKEFATDELQKCVTSIEKGEKWFSPQLSEALSKKTNTFIPDFYDRLTAIEKNILMDIAEKKTSKQIAEENFISLKTVESHRRNILNKLELSHEKNALLIWAIENRSFFSLMD